MKCLPACGFSEYPDNVTVLSRHVESCSVAAPADEKKIVWRDHEFFVVSDVQEDDLDMEVTMHRFEPAPEVKAVDIRQIAEMTYLPSEEAVGELETDTVEEVVEEA
jgi:hypothetical protein